MKQYQIKVDKGDATMSPFLQTAIELSIMFAEIMLAMGIEVRHGCTYENLKDGTYVFNVPIVEMEAINHGKS